MGIIDPERWKLLSPLLDEILTLQDADARAARLDAIARSAPDLAVELGWLLSASQEARREGFLSHSPSAPPQPRPTTGASLGAYTLDRPIGQGGMGEVWLAHRSDGRYEGLAAVKFLDIARLAGPESHARFRREGEILARLAHPNIARLLDAGVTDEGRPYLILEYVDGEPIDRACDRLHLDVAARVRLFLDVLAAAAHAHAHLVVHRDIKPSNVLLAHDGTVKLVDFGIAKLLEETPDGAAVTLTREGPLTPQFASPEQAAGGVVTTSTDVFTLGTLLYMLLTGRHPTGLEGATPADYMRALITFEPHLASAAARDPDVRRALAGDLDNILAKALAPDPAERYATAAAFADDLRRHLDHEPVLAREGTWPYRAARFVRRNRAATALGAIAALAIVGGLAVATREAVEARRQRAAALRQLHVAEATNSFTSYLLSNAAPAGTPLTAADLLRRGEEVANLEFDKDSPLRVHVLLSLIEHYQHAEDYAAAERLATEALALAESGGPSLVRANAACTLGFLRAFSGKLDEASALMERALADLTTLHDPELVGGTCLVEDSLVARRRDDFARAIASAARARDIARANPESPPDDLLDAVSALATAEAADGRAAAALASYRELDEAYRRSGRDRTGASAIAMSNWAIHLFNFGQPAQAAEVACRVVDLDRALDPAAGAKPLSLVSLSNALVALGRYDEAEPLLDEAVEKGRALQMTRWLPAALSARGSLYAELGDERRLEATIAELEVALAAAYPEPHWAQHVLGYNQARLALMRGEAQRALDALDPAIELTKLSKNQGTVPMYRGLQMKVEVLTALGRHAEARALAEECVRFTEGQLQGLPSSYRCGLAYRVLAAAYEAAGDREQAARCWQKAYDHFLGTIGPTAPKTVFVAQKLGR